MNPLKGMNKQDPLKRLVEKQSAQKEFSPMDPPDAYMPPKTDSIPYEKMSPFLQVLMDEHVVCLNKLDLFEEALLRLQKNGLVADHQADPGLRDFFSFLDKNIVAHNQKEEKILFPLLQERLLQKGEHSQEPNPVTAVDMLEDDHIRLMQLAAVTFNFLGLAVRLPDPASQVMVLDAAIEQGKSLVEILRLHIFREDNVAFSLAAKLITVKEFQEMEKRLPSE
ncbi:MAG: hypothetical protein DWQ05_18040 [Calditrichaeota bacterium]|nr:MAG: hypothetical protein DWQ05_18040 [Calditrichota bacterium]